MPFRSVRVLLLTFLLGVSLAGCGGDQTGATSAGTGSEMSAGDEHAEFAFGEPAAASEADRTVEVVASDALAFDPATVTVEVGETILFRITNEGQLPHDFTLGDEAAQQEHEAEMAGGEMEMHDEANAVSIPPGETAELAWTFTEPGVVLYGCHETGHYAAGMKGEITVGS